ncbi:hypothetical protein J2X07_001449 [Fictibacillus barbaricus]|uniref:Uncharacterized protein n=1 Tax=Fictibacillus barbaricus TaxID=182136 RepID=A0ABU1TZ55_9BACL|nr:hypothetical protein [Fictibacillus barbaricus]
MKQWIVVLFFVVVGLTLMVGTEISHTTQNL